MQQKLRDLMTSEGLKSGQLAEMLGINPAGISHILSGRNKPGFELLQKILRRFPRLNPDWLLIDQGPMYRPDYKAEAETASTSSIQPSQPAEAATASPSLFTAPNEATNPAIAKNDSIAASVAHHATGQIERIVIFYSDQTFESFTPNK